MLSLTTFFVGLVFAAVRYSDLPIGRTLYAALIVAPAAWLSKTSPQQIAIISILLFAAIFAWAELGPILMAADYSPILWLADMSLYLDVVLTVTLAATALRIKSIGRLAAVQLYDVLGARVTRPRPRARSSRTRRQKAPPPTEDAPGFAYA